MHGMRKVRAPKGKVPANGWAGRPDGKCHRKGTPAASQRDKLKRCGKSAPARRQRRGFGKPHLEQTQIGTLYGRPSVRSGCALIRAATHVLDKWPSNDRTRLIDPLDFYRRRLTGFERPQPFQPVIQHSGIHLYFQALVPRCFSGYHAHAGLSDAQLLSHQLAHRFVGPSLVGGRRHANANLGCAVGIDAVPYNLVTPRTGRDAKAKLM